MRDILRNSRRFEERSVHTMTINCAVNSRRKLNYVVTELSKCFEFYMSLRTNCTQSAIVVVVVFIMKRGSERILLPLDK